MNALEKSKQEVSSLRSTLSRVRREQRSATSRITDTVTVIAGGAAAGALDAYAPAQVMGIDTDIAAFVLLLGAGLATDDPTPMLIAAGIGATVARKQVGGQLSAMK